MTVHNQPMGRVVRREADGDFVADNDANIEASHLSAKFRFHDDFVFEFYIVNSASAGIDNFAVHLREIISCHMNKVVKEKEGRVKAVISRV